jgi:hypothetical protein
LSSFVVTPRHGDYTKIGGTGFNLSPAHFLSKTNQPFDHGTDFHRSLLTWGLEKARAAKHYGSFLRSTGRQT